MQANGNDLAARLACARRTRRISQIRLAREAGLPPSSISHFESGSRRPSLENLVKLADALEVTTDFLIGREAHASVTPLEAELTRLSKYELDLVRRFVAMLAQARQQLLG